MSKTSDTWTAQQQRQLTFISEFTTDIKHLARMNNVVADCFSRAVIDNVSIGIDYK